MSAAAHTRLNTDVGRPPEALVCLVYIQGDFVIYSAAPRATQPAVTVHEGWLLFDAVTGNLLIEAA
jgi:hypothetical protein